jgi:mono/diheme cytochrome c family protein
MKKVTAMKNIQEKSVKLTGIAVFAVLAFAALSTVTGVFANTQPAPPCCVDRWDPDSTGRDRWEPGMIDPAHRQRLGRHRTFMNEGVPPEYRGQLNPLATKRSVVKAGSALFQKQCAVCHGAEGMGDGEEANSLNPSPALLAYMVQRPQSVDEYLMWTISEGGQAFGTPMPAFKDMLSQEDIWKIVTFMRAGFPPVAQK